MKRFATAAVAALTTAAAATAGVVDNRDVQIKSIDFDNQIVEVHNFATTFRNLQGWRFCTHDGNEQLRYSFTTGLNGINLGPGESLFIHFNNDAPADPLRVNQSTVGTFALPLDQDAYGMQLYFPSAGGTVNFNNDTLIADHLQWNDGGAIGNAERRTDQAVDESLWTAEGEFIVTQSNSERIDLNDLSNGRLHGPTDYDVTNPMSGNCPWDLDGDGSVGAADLAELIGFWGQSGVPADFDMSGAVGAADLAELIGNWGPCPS